MIAIFRKSLPLLLVAFILVSAGLAYAVYQNNKDVPMPDKATIRLSLDRSIQWLHANKANIMQNHNSALW
jgi:hypothetical protein